MNAPAPNEEGFVEVPGARLRFQLSGAPSALPLLVFENGWGASYEYWARVEAHLSPYGRLLLYNRAGIGGSVCRGRQSAVGLSEQLVGLLAALQIREPVILVGHSYGGLMCAVHAAQKPDSVRALLELDPTPDRADPIIDQQLRMVFGVARLAILCAHIGIPDPLFCSMGKLLPPPYGERLVERAFGSVPSLRAAVEELRLLDELRGAIAGGDGRHPQLIVSAGQAAQLKGWLGRRIAGSERAGKLVLRMQENHRQAVGRSQHGAWDTLPHAHGSLVFSEEGAKDSAARILRFVRDRAESSD